MDKVKYFDAKSIKGKYQLAVAADTAKHSLISVSRNRSLNRL